MASIRMPSPMGSTTTVNGFRLWSTALAASSDAHNDESVRRLSRPQSDNDSPTNTRTARTLEMAGANVAIRIPGSVTAHSHVEPGHAANPLDGKGSSFIGNVRT